MNEKDRMQQFYVARLPAWFNHHSPFAQDDSGDYMTDFARLAWAAWQAAQYAAPDASEAPAETPAQEPRRKPGDHKKPHPWRK